MKYKKETRKKGLVRVMLLVKEWTTKSVRIN